MKLAEFINGLRTELLPNMSDACEFASYIFAIPYPELSGHFSDDVLVTEEIEKLMERLEDREPLAYVINNKNFYGLDIYVDSRVLIPRPETEILAEDVIKFCRQRGGKLIMLDICTGSGCIPCAVMDSVKDLHADVLDISADALKVAEKNLGRYASGRYNLIHADALGTVFTKKYDIITCNPPYLSETEWVNSDKSLKYEPKNALSAGTDAELFYKKLIDMIPDLCNKNGGAAFFELGIGQADKIRKMFPDMRFRFIKDYQGIERVLFWTNSL